jgi:hypothetical protein
VLVSVLVSVEITIGCVNLHGAACGRASGKGVDCCQHPRSLKILAIKKSAALKPPRQFTISVNFVEEIVVPDVPVTTIVYVPLRVPVTLPPLLPPPHPRATKANANKSNPP